MDDEHDPTGLWSTYEGNVQAYRGLALSAQSLFLAVGAILLDGDLTVPFVTVFALAMVSTWWVFFPVIFARTAIVDYYKFHLGRRIDRLGQRADSDTTDFLVDKEYARVTNWSLRRKVYRQVSPSFRTMRLTRVKLDLVMPVLLTITWGIFLAYALL